jgi:hypothetical protein
VTVDEFEQFRVNLDYTRRFGTLSNLPPIVIPFPSRPPCKPPFPLKQHCGINLHEMSACEFLEVHSHELEPDPAPDANIPGPSDTLLVNAVKGNRPNPLPPGDIRRVSPNNSKHSANMTQIEYKVSYHTTSPGQPLSIIDRGANGGAGRNQNWMYHRYQRY